MIMAATPFQDKQYPQSLRLAMVQAHLIWIRDTLAVVFHCVHSVTSKSPSFFPLMKVCFDLSISPQTTIKKAIYQINTEDCRSHLPAVCAFPRRGCHANCCCMFIVQKYQFQPSPASKFWGPIQSCCPSPLPNCAHVAKTPLPATPGND